MRLLPPLSATAAALALVGALAPAPAFASEDRGADHRMENRADPGAGHWAAPLDFADVDADGDGVISEAEWEDYRSGLAHQRARAAGLIERFDVDGDGKLDLDELAGALAALPGGGGMAPGRRAAMGERLFAAFDTDGDGMVSPEEFEAGLARMHMRMRHGRAGMAGHDALAGARMQQGMQQGMRGWTQRGSHRHGLAQDQRMRAAPAAPRQQMRQQMQGMTAQERQQMRNEMRNEIRERARGGVSGAETGPRSGAPATAPRGGHSGDGPDR